jgi:argininosuccinate lyase
MSKLWETDEDKSKSNSENARQVEAFTVGNDYQLDQTLVPYDIQASIVHAKALNSAGILNNDELEKLKSALIDIKHEWEKGRFVILPEHEDMRDDQETTRY